jgi:hypothetical protein
MDFFRFSFVLLEGKFCGKMDKSKFFEEGRGERGVCEVEEYLFVCPKSCLGIIKHCSAMHRKKLNKFKKIIEFLLFF